MIHDTAFQALLGRTMANARQREALADQYAAAGKGVRFKARTGLAYCVTPDLEHATQWRVTTFGSDGTPYGHMCFHTAREAFLEAIRSSGAVSEGEDAGAL